MVDELSVSLPDEFLPRMAGFLGEEYPAFVASYTGQRVDGLRVNEIKIESQALVDSLPVSTSPLEGCPSGFVIPCDTSLGHHP